MQNNAKYSCNIITQNMLTKTITQLKNAKAPCHRTQKSRNILTKNASAVITIHLLNFYASCEKLRGRLSYLCLSLVQASALLVCTLPVSYNRLSYLCLSFNLPDQKSVGHLDINLIVSFAMDCVQLNENKLRC